MGSTLSRDQTERGRTPDSVRVQWRDNVEPMRLRHVQPQASTADVTLGIEVSDADLERLANLIRNLAGLAPKPSPRAISARAPDRQNRQAPLPNDRP